MNAEAPRKLALPSRVTATIVTPPESTSLRWRARNLSRSELINPTPDLAMVINDILDFSGANVKPSEKRGSLVGLHAKQLGYDYNIFTVDWTGTTPPSQRPDDYQPHFRVFANVTITGRQGSQISREGCFSTQSGIGGVLTVPEQLAFTGFEFDFDTRTFHEVTITTDHPNLARSVYHEYKHGHGERFAAQAGIIYEITDVALFRASKGEQGYREITGEEADEHRRIATPLE